MIDFKNYSNSISVGIEFQMNATHFCVVQHPMFSPFAPKKQPTGIQRECFPEFFNQIFFFVFCVHEAIDNLKNDT